MASVVKVRHQTSGLVKVGYYGFSWTYLIFTFLVPLFRGEIKIAITHFFLSILTFFAGLLILTSDVLLIFLPPNIEGNLPSEIAVVAWQIVEAFMYNKQYTTRLLEKGYVLMDDEATMHAASRSLGIVPAEALDGNSSM
jgi:hypothetical protein